MISITPIYHDMTRYDAMDGLKALLSQETNLLPIVKCDFQD
jgi:5'-nucleotidase